MKKIMITVLFVFLSFSVFSNDTAHATSDSYKKYLDAEIINKSESFVEIEWKSMPEADSYLIYKDNLLIYEGEKNNFKIDQLDKDEFLEIDLVALSKEKVVLDHNQIKASTTDEHAMFDIEIIGSQKGTKIKWDNNLKYSFYNVKRIDSQNKITFLENSENSNLTTTETDGDIEVNVIYINEEGEDEVALLYIPIEYETFTSPEEKANSLKAEQITIFKHRTFIKKNHVNFPYKLKNNYYVSGDGNGRGFSATNGTHRTQMQISVNWTEGISVMQHGIGKSILYEKVNTVYKERNATTATCCNYSIKRGQNGSVATFRIISEVSIPFKAYWIVPPPSIKVTYDLGIYKNGAVYINGTHTEYPWHEIYRKNYNSSTWSTIYTYNPESYGKNQNGLWTTRRILKDI